MSNERTIILNMDAVKMTQIAEVTGWEKLHAAMGYLSWWNLSFPHVTISGYIDRDGVPEIVASYRQEPCKSPGYVIGAIWHDDHFGFHS